MLHPDCEPGPWRPGLLYRIATKDLQVPWTNPHRRGMVTITASSLACGSLDEVPDPSPTSTCFQTDRDAIAWVCIDLHSNVVCPLAYSMEKFCLRDWDVEASADGRIWVALRHHRSGLDKNFSIQRGRFDLDAGPDFYRYLRIKSAERWASGGPQRFRCVRPKPSGLPMTPYLPPSPPLN
eukprot:TRINITY_DN13696_c0_g1_i1.p1 TRINITY_DN13696_c0_g1~~TRINITY_DN13696_c0_g1_i1.p1  ORF type:complete len:180 (+),score=17.70 TRINITY_DN13696_c0_g1_i1:27-566(+)